jgi:hypothetical protein
VLSVWLFVTSHTAQGLQHELQEQQQALQNQQQAVQAQQQRLQMQQDQINTGNALAQQVGPQVIQAMGNAVIAHKNEKMRGLLKKYGYDVSEKKEGAATPGAAAPAAGAKPAPAAATPENK